MLQKLKTIIKEIGIISTSLTLAFVIFIGLSISNAWTEPAGVPPTGNLSAPLNISLNPQIKDGALQVNGLRNLGNTILDGITKTAQVNSGQYCDIDGANCKDIISLGVTPPTCTGNAQALQWDGSWVCRDISAGTSVNYLVNAQHTEANCTGAGGTVLVDSVGNKFCKFTGACKSGWSQYQGWTQTISKTCSAGTSCTTSSHSWENHSVTNVWGTYYQPVESCQYCNRGDGSCGGFITCSAGVTASGCF